MATLLNNGQHPFYDPNDSEGVVKRKISKGEHGLFKINCSESAMNLLQSLLNIYPNERPVAAAALLHPWLSTTVGLSSSYSPSTVLVDLTRNEDRVAMVLKRLILVAFLRKQEKNTLHPYDPQSSILEERFTERKVSMELSEIGERKIRKFDFKSHDAVLWPKETSKNKLQVLSRERGSCQDSKTFSVSHMKKPIKAKNLPELTTIGSLGSPRKEKPKILANILDKRSAYAFATMEERGYPHKKSPEKGSLGQTHFLRESSGGEQNFFMRQSMAEAKVIIGRSRNSPVRQIKPPG